MSEAKQERLRRLSNSNGVIGALAIDQRRSLRRLIAGAAGVSLDQIPDSDLIAFKTAVAEAWPDIGCPCAAACMQPARLGPGEHFHV